jgi:coenzyme F420-0:L-glutamate ligase/coenzyme F420-1:gamma-L-glutamate ligase
MHATVIAVADQAAAAADLARSKDAGEPAVRLRGLERYVLAEDGPGAAALVRELEHDLFR